MLLIKHVSNSVKQQQQLHIIISQPHDSLLLLLFSIAVHPGI
jgi:hypothetical protein